MDKFIRSSICNIIYSEIFYDTSTVHHKRKSGKYNKFYIFHGHSLRAGRELKEHVGRILKMFEDHDISVFVTMPEEKCVIICNDELPNSVLAKYKLLRKDNEYNVEYFDNIDIKKILNDIIDIMGKHGMLNKESSIYKEFMETEFYKEIITYVD